MYYRHYKGKTGNHKLNFNYDQQSSLEFCMPDYFDEHEFRYNPDADLHTSIYNGLCYAKKQYRHCRLWFSGGVDSRIVLDTAIKNNFCFDEIVIVRYAPTDPLIIFGNLAEVEFDAIPVATEYCKMFPKCKLSIITCDDNYFYNVYHDPDWFLSRNYHNYYFVEPAMINGLVSNGLVSNSNCIINISGIQWPHIYYDSTVKKWKFYYADQSFNQLGHSRILPINILWPELTANCVSELIKYNITHVTNKFNTVSSSAQKQLIPAIRDIKLKIPSIKVINTMLPLHSNLDNTAHDEMDKLHYYVYDAINVSSYQLYVHNTNWQRFKTSINTTGSITKDFILHESNTIK